MLCAGDWGNRLFRSRDCPAAHCAGRSGAPLCRQPDDLKSRNGSSNGSGDVSPSEIAVGDVRDAAGVDIATRGIEAVYHTAGLAGMWGPWKSYRDTNTIGTRNVIDACRRNGVRRLIYTSSPSVVFSEADQRGADESLPYTRHWLCHYPKSKGPRSSKCSPANGKDGLKTCALRPHLIWGPGDRQLLPRLFRRAAAGRLRRVGNGSNEIDIVYVDNAAAAHLQAVANALNDGSPVCGRAYFISQGEPVNCWRWIDELLAIVGLRRCGDRFRWRRQLGAAWETAYRLAQDSQRTADDAVFGQPTRPLALV